MEPRNKRYLIAEVVKRTSIDERKVEAITSYYWKHIRSFLQNPTETSIFLNKLGTFSLIPYFVERYIQDKKVFIERMDKKLEKKEELAKSQMEYYIRSKRDLEWLEERRDELRNEKTIVKIKREQKRLKNEYVSEVKEPMEKQKTNLPGVLEMALQKYQD